MASNNSRVRREALKAQAEERKAVRDKRSSIEQLKVLQKRGVNVPDLDSVKDLDVKNSSYCKEVKRLCLDIQSRWLKMSKYLVVGGVPFIDYRNSKTFLSIRKVGLASTIEEVEKLVADNYDDCGGVIQVFSTETGDIVNTDEKED